MSIEAMRQALVALEHAVPRSMKQAKEQINAIQALRTAIQQAEAKTDEPVAWIDEMLADTKEVFDANGTETPQVVRDVIEYVASWITVYNEKRHPAPGVPEGLQWFTVAEDGLPEVGEVVIGGLWYTDPWLKPDRATSFMWGQCSIVAEKHQDFKEGKRWLTFGPAHSQITHWARFTPPAMLAAAQAQKGGN